MLRLLTTLALSAAFVVAASADTLQGSITHYNDGDSFLIGDTPVRLKGIDAPELAQECSDRLGRAYRCGEMAAQHLKQLVGSRAVECIGGEHDTNGRLVAYCRSGTTDDSGRG